MYIPGACNLYQARINLEYKKICTKYTVCMCMCMPMYMCTCIHMLHVHAHVHGWA